MTFEAAVRPLGDVVAIDLHGDIDGAADDELDRAYTEAESSGTGAIALNFEEVEYINSTGIALIVGILARARKQGRSLSAFGLTDHYREIFEITRLVDFVNIAEDEASAVGTT